jgi:3-deoxy-D-manno-octulosonate 8-phosphate phosphatase (KDO 8-P phosphatase)
MHDPTPVSLLVLDADGVLTDGSIWLDAVGNESKRFDIKDGFALTLWRRMGFRCAIITGRTSGAMAARARELGVDLLAQGAPDKARELDRVMAEAGVRPEQCAYMGDDWPDLAPMDMVGYPMAVADADPAVRARAAYVTHAAGGRGAVREAVEHLLRAKGLMERARALYDT